MKRLILVGMLAALAVTLPSPAQPLPAVPPVALQVAARRTPFAAASPTSRARSGRSSASSSRKPCSRSRGQDPEGREGREGREGQGCQGWKKDKKHNAKFVELARTGEDTIWSVLMEFGTGQATHNHGGAAPIAHGGAAGPLHNQIAQPNRALDNSTIWAPDFSKSYYDNLLFSEARGVSSMRTSTSRTRPAPTPSTARSRTGSRSVQRGRLRLELLRQHRLRARHPAPAPGRAERLDAEQIAAGKTDAQINTYLTQFDKWDRYDYNGNGNFNEPDGYIDHFQSIHAGRARRPAAAPQGADAIWSHRSYANVGRRARWPDGQPLGGVRIGNSSFWMATTPIEPENGGVGVFAHEFGHDLGLPGRVRHVGNTGGAENSTGFWTLWSSGSSAATARRRTASATGRSRFHDLIWQAYIPEYQVRWRWTKEQLRDLGQPLHPALRRAGLLPRRPQDGARRHHRRAHRLTTPHRTPAVQPRVTTRRSCEPPATPHHLRTNQT